MKSAQDANWGCDEEGLFDLLPSGIIKQRVDNTGRGGGVPRWWAYRLRDDA